MNTEAVKLKQLRGTGNRVMAANLSLCVRCKKVFALCPHSGQAQSWWHFSEDFSASNGSMSTDRCSESLTLCNSKKPTRGKGYPL